MFRLPSLRRSFAEFQSTLLRFPLVLFSAFLLCISGILLTYKNPDNTEHWLMRIALTSALAIPSFLAMNLRGRYRGLNLIRQLFEHLVLIAALVAFFLSMDHPPSAQDGIRFAMLMTASHLLVACAGFLGRGTTRAFWQFNRMLFIRIITSGIFSLVLFAGLAGALGALHALFDLDIADDLYGRVFILIMTLFNTSFFLAGVPASSEALEQEEHYPKVLKVFAQFVLLPLVFIYLCILLSYEVKIILTWNLPRGWVSNLVIAYGIVGILSFLLLYPVRNDHHWIRLFTRWFYLLLLPLLVLMFIAVFVRIGNYGLTEPRVIGLLLALWLSFITLIFLFRPGTDIRLIPASLAIVALLFAAGPFSAEALSRNSQRSRLEQQLTDLKLLQDKKAVPSEDPSSVSREAQGNLSSTILYLLKYHGPESLQPWIETDTMSGGERQSYTYAQDVMKSLNLEFVYPGASSITELSWVNFNAPHEAISVEGFDWVLLLSTRDQQHRDSGLHLRSKGPKPGFQLFDGNKSISPVIDPAVFFEQFLNKHQPKNAMIELPAEQLSQDVETDHYTLKIYYTRLAGPLHSDPDSDPRSVSVDPDYSGYLLIRKK